MRLRYLRIGGVDDKIAKAIPMPKWNGWSHESKPIMMTSVVIQIFSGLSPPGRYNGVSNGSNDELVLSRNGKLVAFLNGGIGLASTDPADLPAGSNGPVLSSCALEQVDPMVGRAASSLGFSPVADTMAVGDTTGLVEIFYLKGGGPTCQLSSAIPPFDLGGWVGLVRYSPDGSALAVTVSTTEFRDDGAASAYTSTIKILDATTGVLRATLLAGRWDASPMVAQSFDISDLLWSDAGDQLTVSFAGAPVQHWDIASATLLWQAKL